MNLIDPHFRRPVPCRHRSYGMDEGMHEVQLAAYRRMSPAEKLDHLARLQASATRLMAAGLRMRHPEWSEEQLDSELRERMLYGAT